MRYIQIPRLILTTNAVDFICEAAGLDQFKVTKESQQKMDDLALASQVKAHLVELHSDVRVACEYGNCLIYAKDDDRLARKLLEKVKILARELKGINNIEVHPGVRVPPNAV